jgi:hypothetical protein
VIVSPSAFSVLEFKIYPMELTGVIPKPIPNIFSYGHSYRQIINGS